jgi:tellurite resistance protein
MPRKRSYSVGLLLVLICGIIWLAVKSNNVFLVIVAFAVIVWLINKFYISKNKSETPKTANNQNLITVTISTGPYYSGFKARSSNGDDFWVPAGQSVKIHGLDIGGMVYFGQGLESVGGGGPEPALIDGDLRVAAGRANCHIRYLSYWPSYWGASPEARMSYLQWLSTSRSDPEADIGYVFLYFYGLERRALHDIKTSAKARGEIQLIINEIERLLEIYKKSGSFEGYAGSLCDFLNTEAQRERIFEKSPPPLFIQRWLSFECKLGLAQCASEEKPLPADWALTWLMADPNTYLRKPAFRCPEEFKKLFSLRYHEQHGDGMILPQNRTRLKLQHRVASPTFGYHSGNFEKEFDLPDVSVLTGPVSKLRAIAEDCCAELDGFSRALGKDGISKDSFSALIELPFVLWPDGYRQPIDNLRNFVFGNDSPTIMSFNKFLSFLPDLPDITKRKMLSTFRLLEEAGLGFEPDIRFGGSTPKENEDIALFRYEKQVVPPISKQRYLAVALMLRLAAGVVFADGVASDSEKTLLKKQIESWPHLNETERTRLHAHMCLLLKAPPKPVGLKKLIAGLDANARNTIGNFLTVVAQVDSTIDPKEVSALEKIFKVLGLDPKTLYSKMHMAAVEPVTVRPPSARSEGYDIPRQQTDEPGPLLRLSADKIALLQDDSERVSAILSEIFTPELDDLETLDSRKNNLPIEDRKELSLIGLDAEKSALLQLLMTRTQWARVELDEIAEDRNILLDGALETINEKSYSLFNKPLFEGDDPIILDPEVVREVMK